MIATRLRLVGRARRSGASNWWEVSGQTCVGAWQAVGAVSQPASYVDLSGNGNDLTESGSPGWDSTNGWSLSNSNYLIPGSIGITTNYSAIIRFTSASGRIFGAATYPRRFTIYPQNSGNWYVEYGNSNYVGTGAGASSAVGALVGISTGAAVYKNGSLLGYTGATTVSPAQYPYIGTANPTSTSSCYIKALAIYSTQLSSTDVSNLTSAINALS